MAVVIAQRLVGIVHTTLGEIDRGQDFLLPGEVGGFLRTKTDLTVGGGIVTMILGGPRKGETLTLPPSTKINLT